MEQHPRFRFSDRFRYRFDNLMSKGAPALMGMLGITAFLLVSLISLIIWLTSLVPKESPDAEDYTYFEVFWKSLMRTLDPGTMGGDEGIFGLVMLLVTLVGIFILSTLIGIINAGISDKLDNLRKGRSQVIEKDHTVILGWSSKIFTLISELIVANRNRKNATIVILADKDKVEMEDELKLRIGHFFNTRVVCRRGRSIDMNDLNIVNLNVARSIVILSPEDGLADAHVIKTILAIVNNPKRRKEPYHIVAEIRDRDNLMVAEMVGKDELCAIVSDDLISRITVQTCRHSGLSVVFTELLDFGGVEIYYQKEPRLNGKTFRDAVLSYEESSIFGIRKMDGRILLNPSPDTRFEEGDSVIAISEDDDTVVLSGKMDYPIQTDRITDGRETKPHIDRTLILGWNHKAPTVIHNLDEYVQPESEITVVAFGEHLGDSIQQLQSHIKNQKITYLQDDTTNREVLESLNISSYHNIIILCYSDFKDAQEADAITLITLLHIRDILDHKGTSVNVVCEMLDIQNRELASITRIDDFIVSDKLTSLLLAQLSENRELRAIFDDLFNAEGNEIYLKPVNHYIQTGSPVNFYTICESALQKHEVAIGYKLARYKEEASHAYGVVVNPKKSEMVEFTDSDKIIVISEN